MAIRPVCIYFMLLLAVVPELPAADPPAGKVLFSSTCAACHGLDGRGGEHAPNIASSNTVRAMTDRDLVRIVRFGIPSAGMPGFDSSVSREGITAMVAYLRILQGKGQQVSLPGSPQRGKQLFLSEQTRCFSCHMVEGAGGFLGPDLSGYGQTHNASEIRAAIINPGESDTRQSSRVTIVMKNRRAVSGMVRNEDNFSVQLQTEDGAFALLNKTEVSRIERSSQPIMPSDYGPRLTKTQIDDLVTYLASL